MIFLKPVRDKAEYSELIELKIRKFFYDVIYKPIHDIIDDAISTNYNSKSYISEALLRGQIQYVNGKFTGKFNIRITKELREIGAKYNIFKGTWSLAENKLPMDIKQCVSVAIGKFSKLHQDLFNFINNLDIEKDLKNFDVTKEYEKIIRNLDSDIKDGIKEITVAPQLTDKTIQMISKEYTENMKLYIKGWTDDKVSALRNTVYKNTFDGYRAETLVKGIKSNYNISENKARFLAKQETSLLVSSYKENRYQEIGCRRYRWSSSNDSRVRDSHKQLNGKIFFYSSPPVSGEKGERLNPGKAFGCRCTAVPIYEGK